MIKKWFEIITDHRISLRERMFRIVTGVCMIAIAFTLPMGRVNAMAIMQTPVTMRNIRSRRLIL